MAKKKGGLFKVLLVGAAVAGACYYASQKKTEVPVDMDDDIDLDDVLDDDEVEEKAEQPKRSYVNLNFGDVEQKVQDVVNKVADTANKAASAVAPYVAKAEEKVVEFFDDRKNVADATAEAAEETTEATAEPETIVVEDDDPADAVKTEE